MASEIVTFGEAMLRLSPPGNLRIEQADTFDIQFGGAELNTGVALAQIGRNTEWVSRLPDNALGRLIAGRTREAGVSTEHVLFAPGERLGLFFLEQGASPRASGIEYDRVHSAASRIAPAMVDWKKVFDGAKWFHVSGITAAISPTAAATVTEALQAACAAGLDISFDPNYRSKLWSVEAAKAWYKANIEYVDVLVASPDDASLFFDIPKAEPDDMLKALADACKLKAVAFTTRKGDSVWRDEYAGKLWHGGKVFESKAYDVEVVDRIGAGDAFAAGLIDGLLDDDPQRAVEFGAAMGALKHTVPGDLLFTTRKEVEQVVAGAGLRVRR